MSLEQIYSISQIIAALAVTASLLPLVISIRQNTRAQLTASVESLTAAITAINIPAMESPALGEALSAVRADWWSATREQRIIAHYFLFSFFKLTEQAWYQHRSGMLAHSQWEGWENSLVHLYHSPGVKNAWWSHRQFAYSREFRDFLEATSSSTRLGQLHEIFGTPSADMRPASPHEASHTAMP